MGGDDTLLYNKQFFGNAPRDSTPSFHRETSDRHQFPYLLPEDREVAIGRDPGCQIVIDSTRYTGVSRNHAKIRPLATKLQPAWQICDLNTANGTYLNGKRVEGWQLLRTGDRITLTQNGPEFIFECQHLSTPTPVS